MSGPNEASLSRKASSSSTRTGSKTRSARDSSRQISSASRATSSTCSNRIVSRIAETASSGPASPGGKRLIQQQPVEAELAYRLGEALEFDRLDDEAVGA